MLAYECEQCGRIIIPLLSRNACVNEYGEHFCNENCYKIFCGVRGYNANVNKLRKIGEKL